jgi:hypothetical protein
LIAKRLLAIGFILAAVSGCGTLWFFKSTTVIKIDPAAVTDVRAIGRLVAQTTTDPYDQDTVQVVEILVLDVGASDFSEALTVARARLQQKGWNVSASGDIIVTMESSRWKGTTTRLGRLEDLESFGAELPPEAKKALQTDTAKSSSYVLASLSTVE